MCGINFLLANRAICFFILLEKICLNLDSHNISNVYQRIKSVKRTRQLCIMTPYGICKHCILHQRIRAPLVHLFIHYPVNLDQFI
ncbi:hypothetical protein M758_4G120700 [Ceratodon purpureus]|nr:hypothetical protein M758_4G120700 [Ceratodon purpureus]